MCGDEIYYAYLSGNNYIIEVVLQITPKPLYLGCYVPLRYDFPYFEIMVLKN